MSSQLDSHGSLHASASCKSTSVSCGQVCSPDDACLPFDCPHSELHKMSTSAPHQSQCRSYDPWSAFALRNAVLQSASSKADPFFWQGIDVWHHCQSFGLPCRSMAFGPSVADRRRRSQMLVQMSKVWIYKLECSWALISMSLPGIRHI